MNKNNIDSLWELINLYCFDLNKVIMDSKNENDLDDELSNLKNLAIYNESNIYYFDGHEERNIGELSPGTQANLLMEYIVFKETDIPLLIDQPEDNIDNRTIYNVLTKWFESLKANRQVIVATHDPNIVVNADAENIIICNQINKNKFDYRFGAMEYSDNIEQIANILDGGKLALERRLVKYGEN